MATRNYRLRVAKLGKKVVDSNTTEFTFKKEEIKVDGLPETWGGQNVRPLEGTATSRRFTINLIDEANQILSKLADSEGRANITGRVADLSIEDDGGSWQVTATGRILNAKNPTENPTYWEFEFGDELQWVRDNTVFDSTVKFDGTPSELQASTSLWPSGLLKNWRGINKIVPIEWKVDTVDGNIVVLKNNEDLDERVERKKEGRRLEVLQSVASQIEDDKDTEALHSEAIESTATEGQFTFLRFHDSTNSVDRELRVTGIFHKDNEVGVPKKTSQFGLGAFTTSEEFRSIRTLRVVWPNNQPTSGDIIDGYLYMPGMEPKETVPLHFGSDMVLDTVFKPENGLHILEWAKIVLNHADAKYNATQIDEKINEHDDLPPVWPRIQSKLKAFRELANHVFKPYGFMPVINKKGEIEIASILPTADDVPDVTTLPVYDKDNIDFSGKDHPSLDIQGGNKQITIVNLKEPPALFYAGAKAERRINLGQIGGERIQADNIKEVKEGVEQERTVKRNVSKFGKNELDLEYPHLVRHAFWSADKKDELLIDQIAEGYLDRFNPGYIKTKLSNLPRTIDPAPGSFVRIDLSTYPNMDTASRGGSRLLQVLSNAYTKRNREVQLLDLGPEQQALPAPTVSASQVGPYSIDVTVGGSGGTGTSLEGDYAKIWVIASSTDPADSADGWYVGESKAGSQGTYTIQALSADTTFYVRARQYAERRIASPYSGHASASTSTISAPSGSSVINDLGCAVEVEWTNGNSELKTRFLLDGTVLYPHAEPGDTNRLIRDLSTGTSYTLEIQHVGKFGGLSTKETLSFTTKSTADTGPKPGAIMPLAGTEV